GMSLIPARLQSAADAISSHKKDKEPQCTPRMALLGRFEESILLAAMGCGKEVTADTIRTMLEASIGDRALTTVCTTLDRLEEKGMVESECEAEPTKRKGGRKRLLYRVTPMGRESAVRSYQIS